MEHLKENEAVVEMDDDGGWVDTHHNTDISGEPAAKDEEPAQDMKIDEGVGSFFHFVYSLKTVTESDNWIMNIHRDDIKS